MPTIPKTSLPGVQDSVVHAPRQQGVPMDWNVGNGTGAGIARGIGALAEAVGDVSMEYAESRARLEAAEEATDMQRYMVGFEDMQRDAISKMQGNPNGYGSFSDIARGRMADFEDANAEVYGKLSPKARERLDLSISESRGRFMARVDAMQMQARVTAGLNESNAWFEDQMAHGEYDRADATARGQFDAGYIDRGTMEAKLLKVKEAREFAMVSSDISVNPVAWAEALKRGESLDGFPRLSDRNRELLLRQANAAQADNLSSIMDQMRSDMDDGGDRVTEDYIRGSELSGDISAKDADRLMAIRRKTERRREEDARAADARADDARASEAKAKAAEAKAKAAEAERERTARYDSLMSQISTTTWPSSLEERKAVYASFQEEAMEIYASDHSKGAAALSLLKSCAYPDMPKDSEALAYYEKAYGTAKTGYVGERNADDALYYVTDERSRWYRNDRGNDDDAVEWMRGYVDKEARLWLQLHQDASQDDIDKYMEGLYEFANGVSYDRMHEQTMRRWRSVSPTEPKPASSFVGKDGATRMNINGRIVIYGK